MNRMRAFKEWSQRSWKALVAPLKDHNKQMLESVAEQSAEVLKPFDYRSLETPHTIRVIVIKPSPWNSTESIQCDLQHIQLNGGSSYHALSYEWDPPIADDNDATPPMNRTTIYLNGSAIPVRRNLFHALSHLRHSLGGQPIWIDALSINQSDTPERNHQVGLMGSIYGGATQVLIWPGITEDIDWNTLGALNRESYEDRIYRKATAEAECVSAKVEELCQKGYWKRVWIQQEIFLAQKLCIVHGRHQLIPYETFDYLVCSMPGVKSIATGDVYDKIRKSAAQTLLVRRRLSPTLSPLRIWLEIACDNDLQTSEPRDLIYGMLGVSFDCHDGSLIPDYDKPLLDIYLETILFCRLKQPGRKTERFEKMVAEKLGLSWDDDLDRRIREYCGQATSERESNDEATPSTHELGGLARSI